MGKAESFKTCAFNPGRTYVSRNGMRRRILRKHRNGRAMGCRVTLTYLALNGPNQGKRRICKQWSMQGRYRPETS